MDWLLVLTINLIPKLDIRDGQWEGMGSACPYPYYRQKYSYPTYTQPIVFYIYVGVTHMGITDMGFIDMGYIYGYP